MNEPDKIPKASQKNRDVALRLIEQAEQADDRILWHLTEYLKAVKLGRRPLRDEVVTFTEQMETTLKWHDPEKGDSWKTCDPHYLLQLLKAETEELDDALTLPLQLKMNGYEAVAAECVDVANLAMMLYHRCQQEAGP